MALRKHDTKSVKTPMQRILIADDHPLFRDALRGAVVASFGRCETTEASTFDEAVALIRQDSSFDLVLLDLNMPGVNGFSGLLSLRAQFPALPVAIVTALEDAAIAKQAIDYGAVGFIPKSTPREVIGHALRAITNGEIYLPPFPELENGTATRANSEDDREIARRLASLTAQQVRVLDMLGTGKLNKEIAYELNIAETTVKAHVSAILQKLKVYSRTQAVVFASRLHFDKFDVGAGPRSSTH
jgi:DNA-binding NarL/FixJ family response regulator